MMRLPIAAALLLLGAALAVAAPNPPVAVDKAVQRDLEQWFAEDLPLKDYPYQDIFETTGKRHGLPTHFLITVARLESAFKADAVSHKNAVGLMQLLPETAKLFGYSRDELFEPEKNIDAGASYLGRIYAKTGDPYLTLAGYYCGENAVSKGADQVGSQCKEYVQLAWKHYAKVRDYAKAGKDDLLALLASGKGQVGSLAIFVFRNNLAAAERFAATVELKDMQLDVFRQELVEDGLIHFDYQVTATYQDISRTEACRRAEAATAFKFCSP